MDRKSKATHVGERSLGKICKHQEKLRLGTERRKIWGETSTLAVGDDFSFRTTVVRWYTDFKMEI